MTTLTFNISNQLHHILLNNDNTYVEHNNITYSKLYTVDCRLCFLLVVSVYSCWIHVDDTDVSLIYISDTDGGEQGSIEGGSEGGREVWRGAGLYR